MRFIEIYLLISSISFTFGSSNFTPTADFCNKISCKQETHVYCHNNTYKSEEKLLGKNPYCIDMDGGLKQTIVKKQNMYRNLIACSNNKLMNLEKKYLPNAGQMNELEWDDELEFIADAVAATCRLDFNYCPSTPSYPDAGMIMARRAYSTFMSHADVIEDILLSWFTTYINVPLAIIREFKANQPIRKTMKNFTDREFWIIREMGAEQQYLMRTGNALQLMQDDATKMACSMYICGKENGQIQYLYVCVYDQGNIEGKPVYEEDANGARFCEHISPKNCCLCVAVAVANSTETCFNPILNFEVANFNGIERSEGIPSILLLIICLFVL